MGIVDLWKLIADSEKKFSLEQISNNAEKKGKCLRVAIDVALWTFQVRVSIVGDGSEIRAIFFRFCRLYELGIRPVFVFDGVHRPNKKRNKIIDTQSYETNFSRELKQLIRLFNFSQWEAYGEAEAECAMLERLGFVDMVFTGDSDVFLFGARHVVRQWPTKRNEAISCYDQTWITDTTGLDRSDLILIALLRGCDYDTQGTKGIGIHVAAQLAKCQFHRKLMDDIQLAGRDQSFNKEQFQQLFDAITYELRNNVMQHLNKRKSGVVLDTNFFDFSIVNDFIHPKTNIEGMTDIGMVEAAKELETNLNGIREPDWVNLACFTQMCFKWPAEYLLKRFSSLLYPGYMANALRRKVSSGIKPKMKAANNLQHDARQTNLEQFYRSTPRFHKEQEKSDLIQISGSKIANDKLKLYRVEWDRITWDTFQKILKLKLDFEIFINDAILKDSNAKNTTDPFLLVKRQWVDASQVHKIYSSLALKYQTKSSKNTLVNSFLILPPKRQLK